MYEAVDINASCIFKGNNLSENKDYPIFFKNAECITTGDKAKFICKDIIVKEGYLSNIDKKINLIKLYIKDLDEFIRVTNGVKEHSFTLHNAKHISEIEDIKPIDIGEIKANINLSFCFDWRSGGTDIGYYHCTEQTQITPYVKIMSSNNVSVDDTKIIIYEFIVLYSILTGKNEVFNRIEFKNFSKGKAELFSQPQWLFSNSFKMNESEQLSKYSVFNSMFPLGRSMSDALKKLYNIDYELSNDVFYKFLIIMIK